MATKMMRPNVVLKIERMATGRILLLTSGILVAVMVLVKVLNTPISLVRIKQLTDGEKILDLQRFYTAEQAYATLETLGESGRQAYAHFLLAGDLLLPLAYGLFLTTLLAYSLRRLFRKRESAVLKLSLLPLFPVVLDLLENAAILGLLFMYPERANGLATIAGLLTFAKSSMLYACLLLAAVVLAAWGVVAGMSRLNISN